MWSFKKQRPSLFSQPKEDTETSSTRSSMTSSHLRSPEELVKFILHDSRYSDPVHNLASVEHRQNLVKIWGIPRGATILEIGCGQGDFTVPVADAVGPSGHVIAIDPGSP